ncbi:gliding motility protein GldM [Bacteroidia bacterium]|nr:gliding motility protein GldM [Bacteroidia bacterium]
MSSKNCEETPRQKMIGVMYLVLTAMLALNVTKDVLLAFATIQSSLNSNTVSFQEKNIATYHEIDMAFELNPVKVKTFRDKALEIKAKSASIVRYADSVLHRMVSIADGAEKADIHNIEALDNLDVGGQVMIVEGEGKVFEKMLDEYRELLLNAVAPEDTALRQSIYEALNTDDPPVHEEGELHSWESSRFEHIPLGAVASMLAMYQMNVVSAESDVIRYGIAALDAESFKFNKLSALIIPDSRYVFKGETVKAKVMLAAVDTTMQPEIIANGRQLKYEGDFGMFSEAATSVGIHTIKGVINYVSPSGKKLPREFSMEYVVSEPAVVISPTKMNVFYVGVDNPVSLAVPGMSADEIAVEITNGQIIKQGEGYIVRPQRAGKSEITVFAKDGNQRKKLQSQEFRVKEVPDPVANVGTFKEGTVKKNILIASGGVSVELENFDFNMKFTVQSFTVSTVVEGYVRDANATGASFTKEQIKLIQDAKRNQPVYIEKIIVKGPDGSTRRLPSLPFKID